MRLSLLLTAATTLLAAPVAGQASRWCDQAPRAGYETLERVRVRDPWFHVYRVDPGVFALYEPYNFQEVISWLVVGTERALLFDTGMGMSRISAVVRELTRLPIIVVNSHTHYDHVGGNAEFSDLRGMDTWYTRESAAGIPHHDVTQEVTPQAFCAARLRVPFDTSTYAIRPFSLRSTIRDGSVIPLGGRQLEVLHIPGHTPDAIALLDRAAGLLWTGDTFYPGPIWLFFPGTDHAAYAQSVSRLAALVPTLRKVLPAHNFPVVDPAVLARVPAAYAQARAGQITGAEKPDGLIEYPADGFSFLMRRPEPPLRVLFIGNSYTYFNNLPEIVADFARLANTSREIRVESIVRGGATLRDHWDAGTALARLRATPWDFVVLQEQSMLGLALQDGRPTINDPGFFHHYARLFVDQVKAAGATPVFFLTWSRRATPELQPRLTRAYQEIARATGARLASVGPAWQAVRQQRPDLELYASDGTHPSPTGSYLAAATIWSTISGATPVGLPRRARGRLVVDSATGSRFSDTTGFLVQLPESDAAFIQRTIAATSAASEPPDASPPATPPNTAALPPRAQLLGEWKGRMALYDDSVDVTLQLADSGGRLVGQWMVHGAGWSSSTRLTQPDIDGNALAFLVADPRFLAPTERHRAVWVDGALHGTVTAGT
ncbi:MAG: MBL fold metallo-hydrolase, partial [Gemmatimonadetes bacterium]|nr:MBL fold metallo-hydrolase [Gemmatimonadota bacterium]